MMSFFLPLLLAIAIPVLMIVGGFKSMEQKVNSPYGCGCGGCLVMVLGILFLLVVLCFLFI